MEDPVKFFRGVERYNCAQAMLKGFQKRYQILQETIDAFKVHGSGRAESNLCGALFAAKYLLKDKEKLADLENKFSEATGGIQCREIRKLNRVPCAGCLQAATQLLNEFDAKPQEPAAQS